MRLLKSSVSALRCAPSIISFIFWWMMQTHTEQVTGASGRTRFLGLNPANFERLILKLASAFLNKL